MESPNYKEVLDSLLDGVYVTDEKGVTLYVNPAYCKHIGVSPQELLGRPVDEIAGEGVLFQKSVSQDVIRLGRNVTGTGVMKNRAGKPVQAYVTGVPILDGEGKVKNVAVSVYDTDSLLYRVTEFKNTMKVENAIRVVHKFGQEDVSPMVGSDPAIKEIHKTIARAAGTDVTILITGESGVGKEAVADRIYAASSRQGKPFVKVNCTAIPANLLESELFGYEKGAFTGASNQGKAGLFELANHGTILLDEIGDLPYEMQTKLLRALQQKEIMRIGGKKPIQLDVRVIAATNADLKKRIKEGAFREDLYYRLAVVPIYVPPLRERRGDIPNLVRHFFFEYCTKHTRTVTVPREAIKIFQSYDWPGNVRELQNVVEYMVICSEGNILDPKFLSEYLTSAALGDGPAGPGGGEETSAGLHAAMDAYEKRLLENALRQAGGVRKAAALLRVDPSTVSRKAKKHGIPCGE